jgi:HEAT repeat protein
MRRQNLLALSSNRSFHYLQFSFALLAFVSMLPGRGWPQPGIHLPVNVEVERLNNKSETAEIRVSAARALGHLDSPTDAAIQALISSLRDKAEDERVRRAAINALAMVGRFPGESDQAVGALVNTLADRHSADSLRAAAARTLGKILQHPIQANVVDQAIAVLVDALTKPDPDPLVRANAAWSLGQIDMPVREADNDEKQKTVKALIQAVKSTNVNIGQTAAQSLVKMYDTAVPELTLRLNADEDANFKWNVARILGEIGEGAKDAVPTLTRLLNDDEQDPNLRGAAAWAIGKIGTDAKAGTQNVRQTVSVLKNSLANKDDDPNVRSNAAWALGRIGPDVKPDGARFPDAIASELGAALADMDPDIRRNSVWALGQIDPDPKKSSPGLAETLQMDHDPRVRAEAALALGRLGSLGRDEGHRVHALAEALKNDTDSAVRRLAAVALGQIGGASQAAIDELAKASEKPEHPEKEKEQDKNARFAAAEGLVKIANALTSQGATGATEPLEKVAAGLEKNDYRLYAAQVKGDVRTLRSLLWFNRVKGVLNWIQRYRAEVLVICGYICFWFLLYWKNPYLIFRINEALKPYVGQKLPNFFGGIPLSYLVLGGLFHYRPRVLDAWVAVHIGSARTKFLKKLTVDQRDVHVDLPVFVDGVATSALSAAILQSCFESNRNCVLISGEGGSGKTSLACQVCKWAMSDDAGGRLGKHPMISVLLDLDNAEASNGHDILVEAVRTELRYLIDPAEAPSEELVEKLMENRRILVVVDGYSEMSEVKRNSLRPGSVRFAARALIITSRLEESPAGVDLTVIKPMRVQGDHLSTFMEAYLVQRGKKDLFDDAEYFDDLGKLSRMVGERDITVLLARLYAEQMIAAKEVRSNERLPENIPDLMLEYLNALNRKALQKRLDDRVVHRVAKIIAWECLTQTFRPMPAITDRVVQRLDGEVPVIEERLKFLEGSLRLVQTVGAGRDRIRFTLDPLAEYLAALKVMEDLAQDEQGWRHFLARAASAPGAPEAIRGFLLAVRDCCLVKGGEVGVPNFVSGELGRTTGVDPAPERGGDAKPVAKAS